MAHILVIDDDEQILGFLFKALSTCGHQVFLANGGKEGIRCCSRNAIDLVITDIIMPDGEGLETIMHLKQLNPEITIFAITGNRYSLNMDVLAFASQFGAARTFEKPFSLNELVDAVETEMQAKQSLPGAKSR
jgi:DNA-binding NtrC family response regulator